MLTARGAYVKSKSVPCEHCGSRAQFVRRLPDMARGAGVLNAYICIVCHKETEIAAD